MREQLTLWYEKYSKILGYDPASYEGITSITINWQYYRHQELNQINNAILAGKDYVAIQVMRDLSVSVVDQIKSLPADELLNHIEELQTSLGLAKEISTAYTEWVDGFYKEFLEIFMSHGLFDADELTPENINPQFFITLDESTKYLSTYRYKTGLGSLDGIKTAGMRIADDVMILEDISQFFSYLRTVERDDDVVYAHLILKIEEREDLSHFIMALTYNGHVFLTTDAPTFVTPAHRENTRNARRHMESKYDNLAFPYILIDELSNIRKNNTTVAVYGDYSMELYKEPIKRFDAYCKLFIIGIADKLRQNVDEISTEAMLLSDYVNTKLIGHDMEITDADADKFIGHKDKQKVLLEGLKAAIGSTGSNGLIKVGAEMVVASEYYDKNWLATPEQLEFISKWIALDVEREVLQKELNDKFAGRSVGDEAIEWLNTEINKSGNLQRLLPYIFAGDEVHVEIEDKFDVEGVSFDPNNHVDSKIISLFNDSKSWYARVRLGFNVSDINNRREAARKAKIKIRSMDDFLWRDTCDCCGKDRNVIVKHMRIPHWKIISLLLDIEPSDIPPYFQMYRMNHLLPYKGNSISSAVHPLSLVRHPSWLEFEGGIPGTVHICKRCTTKYKKQYKQYDNALIKSDGSIVDLNGKSSLRFMSAY